MKVLLNCLPPSNLNFVSMPLAYLKSTLDTNGHTAKIAYWNILCAELMSYYAFENETLTNILPFLAVLSETPEFEETSIKQQMFLQSFQPTFKSKQKGHFYENSLNELRKELNIILDRELDSLHLEQYSVAGISARFFQWIPGRVLARKLKERKPDIKIVVGGFGNHYQAELMLKKVPEFDMAIWGEGEYPLVELCDALERNQEVTNIPRLIYRENGKTISSPVNESRLLDLDENLLPDYEDYFEYIQRKFPEKFVFRYSINSSRSCHWAKCKFCNYFHGSKYRTRKPEKTVEEIIALHEKYGHKRYYFVDNEIGGGKINEFEKFLDLVIELKKEKIPDLEIFGQIIPEKRLNDEIFHKMKLAGFSYTFTGLEALSDSLLKKMVKKNTFAQNLQFLKFAVKNSITPQAGLVVGTLDESAYDVHDSLNNLHYLRFFYNKNGTDFYIQKLPLQINVETPYYKEIGIEELKSFNYNMLVNYYPDKELSHSEKLGLFGFWRDSTYNEELWSRFFKVEKHYLDSSYEWKIEKNKGGYLYSEFLNKQLILSESLSEIEYKVLTCCSEGIVNIEEVVVKCEKSEINTLEVKEILNKLNSLYILYTNKDYSENFSIIQV